MAKKRGRYKTRILPKSRNFELPVEGIFKEPFASLFREPFDPIAFIEAAAKMSEHDRKELEELSSIAKQPTYENGARRRRTRPHKDGNSMKGTSIGNL